jgi:hypothetical protein
MSIVRFIIEFALIPRHAIIKTEPLNCLGKIIVESVAFEQQGLFNFAFIVIFPELGITD